MKFNQIVLQRSFNDAFNRLASGIQLPGGNVVKPKAENITAPACIIQEQAFVNTVNNYTFEFGTSAPAPTAALGNKILGQNNVMVICALQILIGYGANANNRRYFSRGITQDDNSLYAPSVELLLQLESNQPIQKFSTKQFYEEGSYINGSGMVPIQPLRVLTGLVSRFQVVINFPNPITGLTLSNNMFISVQPYGAIGLA